MKFFEEALAEVEDEAVVETSVVAPLPSKTRSAVSKPAFIRKNHELSDYWDDLIPMLKDLRPEDEWSLGMMVMHYSAAQRAFVDLAGDDLVVEDEGVARKSPLEAIFRAQSASFLRYASMFGMTARSRALSKKPESPRAAAAANPFK